MAVRQSPHGIVRRARNASRYDVVLAFVPLALLAALAVHSLAAIHLRTALAAAAAAGLASVLDVLFRNPPDRAG